ncbi:MAG: urea transport system substrate-binding protein [Actinomycetota bacterium]|nr:urea transport system substrate-binding protein [Actinomycetota bacterium]
MGTLGIRRRPVPKSLVAGLALAGVLLAACGSDSTTTGSGAGGTAADKSTVKVGVLQSLSGTMSISEVAVKNSELLAIDEINKAGGVMGKQLEPVVRDGKSDWPTFAQELESLITTEKVAVTFGGWTSASRKAMKPVVEGLKGLLFYPVQYEGLEVSPNIFYTGATTNQQIVPGLDYLKEKGLTKVFLVGSDYVFPRTANKEIKAYAAANGMEILGEEYLALGDNNAQGIVQKVLDANPQVVFNTLNGDTNVSFFNELKAKGNTPEKIQTISVSIAEEETAGVGIDNLVGHLVSWNYYQTTDLPKNKEFVAAYQAKYGTDKHTDDPIEAGYNSVYIWKAAVEKAQSFDVAAVTKAAGGLVLETPEGTLTVHPSNHHVYKTARIGMVNSSGLIDEVWNSGKPIAPDPCLDTYPWAAGLATGSARAECDAAKAS